MTLDEFLASITCPPNLSLEYSGRALRDDASTVYVRFRGPDSEGKKWEAVAYKPYTLPPSINVDSLTDLDIKFLTFEIDQALHDLWEHEYKETFRVDGVPVHAPHHSDGSFT